MLEKIVEENQRDWDTKVKFVMAVYRAYVNDATGFMPNFLVLGREVRSLLDIILGQSKQETSMWQTYADFVADRQNRMRSAYDAVRENYQRDDVPNSERKHTT